MRKWMRDRLKRRKKPAEQAPGETGPSPLQPAYFEPDSSEASSPPVAEEPQPEPEPVVAKPKTRSSGGSERPAEGEGQARRRRRRGGRGRSKGRSTASKQEKAAVSTEPAVAEEPSSDEPAPAVAPPAHASKAAPRTSRGVVVLAIGLPGSGKSSWFKRHSITPLSSDLLRGLLFDDPQEQRFQDLVFSNLRSMLKARLIARRPMNYVDATNLTSHDRHSWIKLAKDFGYEVHAVFFDVPVEVCIDRNQRRERKVAEDVMRRMASKMRAPTFDEGFGKITVVKVKKKEEPAP